MAKYTFKEIESERQKQDRQARVDKERDYNKERLWTLTCYTAIALN